MSRQRISWKNYFMNIAREVATRSTCSRKHVGAVIVRDKTILSTGYNGSIKGLPHCVMLAVIWWMVIALGHHMQRQMP